MNCSASVYGFVSPIQLSYLGERVDGRRLQAILAAFPKQREEHAAGRNALLLRLQLQLPPFQLKQRAIIHVYAGTLESSAPS